MVADAGYSSGTAAAACEADGITACVPTNRSIHSQGDGTMFGRSAFVYQPEADTYMCPAGHVLARKQVIRHDHLIVYAARDCAGCSLKSRCTTAERRFVSRHLHEDALERMNARFQADPTLSQTAPMCQRTSFRNHQANDRRRQIPHSRPQESRRGSSTQRARLQPHSRD